MMVTTTFSLHIKKIFDNPEKRIYSDPVLERIPFSFSLRGTPANHVQTRYYNTTMDRPCVTEQGGAFLAVKELIIDTEHDEQRIGGEKCK